MSSILVVDDDPRVLRVLRIVLSGHGYTVLTAHDGAAALRAVTDATPDAVVLDLGLPDIHGVEVIARLRRRTSVPIVVFSARTSAAEQSQALHAGAGACLAKPAPVTELVARLRAALDRRATERRRRPGASSRGG